MQAAGHPDKPEEQAVKAGERLQGGEQPAGRGLQENYRAVQRAAEKVKVSFKKS